MRGTTPCQPYFLSRLQTHMDSYILQFDKRFHRLNDRTDVLFGQ